MKLSNPQSVLLIVLVMWLIRILDAIVPIDFNQWGLLPRTLWGLAGIALMPFLHGGFGHLLANTLPLTVLLLLTTASRHRAWETIAGISVGGGGLLWLVGRPSNHVGASLLIFGLIAYLIMVGIREKKLHSLAISLLVGVMFGATLVSGILPVFGTLVSWEGHLCGAIAGVIAAIITTEKQQSMLF